MLIELRVENYRSIRDEQALSMESADSADSADPRSRRVQGYGKRLLPAVALYGANASGKSNVLSARNRLAPPGCQATVARRPAQMAGDGNGGA